MELRISQQTVPQGTIDNYLVELTPGLIAVTQRRSFRGGVDDRADCHTCMKAPPLPLLAGDFAWLVGFLTSSRSHFTAEFRIALQCLRWLLCSKHSKVMLPKSCLSPSEKEKG
ncbi:hypothetical protein Q5P01_004250 [Channa striata]|uniref:Uncharacterized protein n=1 Tax=Channa striata TaxID=64152 RepID=A0AA88NNB6_CHASR|nr:hypothetical protein Q5P01_004250 [Channa striata]